MAYGSDQLMLNCTKCGEIKHESEFYAEAKNPNRNYKRSNCKACDYIKQKKYASENREKMSTKDVAYRRERLRFFPPELFEQRLKEQGNVCAICGTDTPGGRGAFHADHDHIKEKPRGVLCHSCNVGLGHFSDDIELIQAALDYLKKYLEVN